MSAEKPEGKHKQNSNVLIVIISFLLLVSIAMSVFGLLNGESSVSDASSENSEEATMKIESQLEDESLSDMFQKEFSERSNAQGNYDYDDPFKEICAPVSGSDFANPSFTVCQPK